jgi:hypothetical protein
MCQALYIKIGIFTFTPVFQIKIFSSERPSDYLGIQWIPRKHFIEPVKLDALKTRMDVQPVFNPCLSD